MSELPDMKVLGEDRETYLWLATAAALILALTSLAVSLTDVTVRGEDVVSQRFTLVDQEGRKRGEFAVGLAGQPSLVLLDENGNARISVAIATDNSSVITLMDPKLSDRIRLTAQPNGSAAVSLLDRSGKERTWLGTDRKGFAALNLFSAKGKPLAAFGTFGGNTSGLSLFDGAGKERAGIGFSGRDAVIRLAGTKTAGIRLSVSRNSVSALRLHSGAGAVQLAVSAEAVPSLLLDDGAKKARGQIRPSAEGAMTLILKDSEGNTSMIEPSRLLVGKDGSVVWSAP